MSLIAMYSYSRRMQHDTSVSRFCIIRLHGHYQQRFLSAILSHELHQQCPCSATDGPYKHLTWYWRSSSLLLASCVALTLSEGTIIFPFARQILAGTSSIQKRRQNETDPERGFKSGFLHVIVRMLPGDWSGNKLRLLLFFGPLLATQHHILPNMIPADSSQHFMWRQHDRSYFQNYPWNSQAVHRSETQPANTAFRLSGVNWRVFRGACPYPIKSPSRCSIGGASTPHRRSVGPAAQLP